MPLAQVSQHAAGVEYEIDRHTLPLRVRIIKVFHNRSGVKSWWNFWKHVLNGFAVDQESQTLSPHILD